MLFDCADRRYDYDCAYCDYDYADADKPGCDEWIEYWGEYVVWFDGELEDWGDGGALIGGAVPIENNTNKFFGIFENGGYDIDVAEIACSDQMTSSHRHAHLGMGEALAPCANRQRCDHCQAPEQAARN